jgi:hypothetical protein
MKNSDKTIQHDLPFVVVYGDEAKEKDQEGDKPKEFRVRDLCPVCMRGHFDYNGVLNLECDECKYILAGCFT